MGLMLFLSACVGGAEEPAAPTEVILMLDWVPNTNHTGIFVTQAEGYFADEGLAVEIIQPGEVYAEQAVAGGAVDFGISFQEQVTLARADDVPIVSIAAIIQHNTSGFASPAALGVESPADWAGLRYGSWGSPFEEPTLAGMMACDEANIAALTFVDTGFADPLALLQQGEIDLAWIFYGWQGIAAEQQGLDLDIVMMSDWFECIPDYYTPLIIAHEETLQERPEVVRAFLSAISRGYAYAIENPEAAADILLVAAPENDPDLVYESQAWLSAQYQADAPRWGEQRLEVWQDYSDWMAAEGILAAPIDAEAAFTNDFLP
jgi:ABC-type nitrate/sulfonate/bicarbonate transport system substrate-binding protein